jgi:hypothetical protein
MGDCFFTLCFLEGEWWEEVLGERSLNDILVEGYETTPEDFFEKMSKSRNAQGRLRKKELEELKMMDW